MARDDFTKAIIDRLQKRVANRCSRPECRCPTIGPGANAAGFVSMGTAAHIHAAAPGGPRYKPDMTREERGGFENAIWLCRNCATLIDRDVEKYPAEVLQQWKAHAEAKALLEIGNRLAEPTDAIEQMSTMMGGQPSKFIPSAIGNVHAATIATLTKLDPRFEIESEFRAGVTHFRLNAKEPIPLTIHVEDPSAKAWTEGMRKVTERGKPVRLPMQGVTFVGSSLLQAMQELVASGSMKVSPVGKAAVFKFIFSDHEGQAISELFNGDLTVGRDAAHFAGVGSGGIVQVEINLERNKEVQIRGDLQLHFDFTHWQNVDARRAPYIDKVYPLLRCLAHEPESLTVHLEVDGEHVLTGKKLKLGDNELFNYLLNFVGYIRRARTVARGLSCAIPIDVLADFTEAEHLALDEAAQQFEGKRKYDISHFAGPPKFTLSAPDDGRELRALASAEDFKVLEFRNPSSEVKIFGRSVPLPPTTVVLQCVRLKIMAERCGSDGMEFDVETEYGPDFLCEYRFTQE